MSTPVREMEASPPSALPISTTMALVPVVGDRGPRPVRPGEQKPVNAHRLFFGAGYAGLALVWTGVWMQGLMFGGFEACFLFGGLSVALGGFGVVIHTLWKPNERKVRHLLLALASLALTLASIPLVQRVSREMYAAAAVERLQPLAEALAKDARIRRIGVNGDVVALNGYSGSEYGAGSITGDGERVLEEVLASDGISRAEFQAYRRWLEREGIRTARRTSSTVLLGPGEPYAPMLLYVMPGHPLPRAHTLVDHAAGWRSEPLGGSWYLLVHGRR